MTETVTEAPEKEPQEKGDLQAAFAAAIEAASKSHRKQESAGLKQIEAEQQKQADLKQERAA